jgi:hypothetical protein
LPPAIQRHLRPADEILRESEAYFMQAGKVHRGLQRLAQYLERESIPYALVGGMALNLWGFARETLEIDILLTCDGLKALQERLVGGGYVPAFAGAMKSFRDPETQVKIETLTTGEYPGDGKPKLVSFPDPRAASVDRDGYRLIRLEKLIELKLASGLSAAHRLRDLADVQDLILALKLPLELGDALDESVRGEYRRMWDAAQHAA